MFLKVYGAKKRTTMDMSNELTLNWVGLLFGLMITILLIYTIYSERNEKTQQHINVSIIIFCNHGSF